MALGTPVIGTAVAGSGSSPAVPYPASVGADDQLLMICVQRPSSIGGGTFTPPAGWTTILTLIDKGGYGSATTDTGNTNLFIAAKDALAAGGETGTLTATVGGNNAAATAMVCVPTGGGRITFDVTGGEQTTGGSVSVALAADPGIKSGDVLLWGMTIPTDVTTPSQFSSHSVTASGATIGSATELIEFDSTAGNDLGGYAAWASCTAGASSGVPTVAATAGGTTTNVRGPVGLVVIRENAGTVMDRFNKNEYISTYGGDLSITNNLINLNAGARIRSTTSRNDRRYLEITIGSLNSSEQMVAVANSSAVMSGSNYGEGANITSYKSGGNVHVGGTYAATIASFAAGDIVGTEIDPAQGVRWRVNGGSWSSWFALPSGSDFYHVSMLRVLDTGQQTQTLNFGQSDGSGFAYTVPSGAQGWDQTAGGPTSYTLTAAVGAFTLSGQTANLLRGYLHTAAVGAFTLTGQDANLARGYVVAADVGTFTLTGQSALFPVTRQVAASVGAFVLTGQAAGLKRSLLMTGDLGSFTLSGQDVTFKLGKGIAANVGAFSLSGQDAGLKASRSLAANVGTFTLTGQSANLTIGRTFPASVGAFTVSGQDAGLTIGRTLQASVGTFDLTGRDAALTLVAGSGSRTLTAETGAFAITGIAASLILVRNAIYGPPRNDNRTIYGAARSDDLTITGPARNNTIVIAA